MAKVIDLHVVGLDDLFRALKQLPKEANQELRLESVKIAERHMLPSWQTAASSFAGNWGPKIAASIRVKRDRVPTLVIGYAKKVYSGGASTVMTRYPADIGIYGRAGDKARMFGEGTSWMSKRYDYRPQAFRDWSDAVEMIVTKWNVRR
tara:strand:+ start:155 stop:601 length:447 start_codon:yes stop_codon:yes gene_type:complete